MRNTVIFILGICWPLFSRAQQVLPKLNEQEHLDRMRQVIDTTTSDSTKANTYFLLSDYWRFKDTVVSKDFLEKGRRVLVDAGMFDKEQHTFLKSLYYFYLGQLYFNWDQDKAADAYLTAAQLVKNDKSVVAYKQSAASWYNYSIMKRSEKGDEFLIDILLNKSIPYIEKTGDREKTAHYYSQLGTLLMDNGQEQKAEKYFDKAIELLEETNNESPTLVLVYLSSVDNLIRLKKQEKAKKQLDKAKHMLEPFPQSINNLYYYYQESAYLLDIGDIPSAERSIEKGLVLAQQNNQVILADMLLLRKFTILKTRKSYTAARDILKKVLDNNNYVAERKYRREVYKELVGINELLRDIPQAYLWLSKYSALSDSLNEEEVKVKVNEMEARYRAVENEKMINQLEADKKEAALHARNNRLLIWIFAISSGFLLIVSGLVYLNYRNSKKLMLEKELNHEQQIRDLHQAQYIEYSKAIMKGEENERRRLAQDLHDGLGGMLAGVKINLSGKMDGSGELITKPDLYKVIDQLDHSVVELRRIAHNMMPVNLIKFGLETAVRDLCESLMNEQAHIDFQAFDINKNIPEQTQINIYRIVQELLNNALKHAAASNIILQCSQVDDVFFITLEDDGKGFDIHNVKEGMGLQNIKNRVGFLDGKVEIDSKPGEGTTINIELHV